MWSEQLHLGLLISNILWTSRLQPLQLSSSITKQEDIPRKKQQYLSDPKSVTGTVFPAQKVKLVTGCYLNVVPCRQSKNHMGLKTEQHLSAAVENWTIRESIQEQATILKNSETKQQWLGKSCCTQKHTPRQNTLCWSTKERSCLESLS